MTFDKKLTWKAHIADLKKDCLQRLNIIKTLANHRWGADRNILLRIYSSLIRSKLDYGSIAYSSARPSTLKTLDTIQNTAIRISTGALRTSPIMSLLCEANQMPLKHRRSQLCLAYVTNLTNHPKIPVYSNIFANINQQISILNTLPLHELIQNYFSNINIYPPDHIYQNPNKIEPWTLQKSYLDLTLTKHPKTTTHPETYHQSYQELMSKYKYYHASFTDGSKINKQTGAAVIFGSSTYKYHLPDISSVFTAEIYGILQTTELIKICPKNQETSTNFLIHTDSLAAINSLKQLYPDNFMIQQIQKNIHEAILDGKRIVIIWIPSHIGIPGNEKADKAARDAVNEGVSQISVPTYDYKSHIKQEIKSKWNSEWSMTTNNHLRMIKEDCSSWLSNGNRKEQIIITRLRIGHTLITHKHLFERKDPVPCETCNAPMTVQHIILECVKYQTQRSNNNLPTTLKSALSNNKETLPN